MFVVLPLAGDDDGDEENEEAGDEREIDEQRHCRLLERAHTGDGPPLHLRPSVADRRAGCQAAARGSDLPVGLTVRILIPEMAGADKNTTFKTAARAVER